MRTWGEDLKENDVTLNIYSYYYDKYNSRVSLELIPGLLKEEYAHYFNDPNHRDNALIGLALAQWETKMLGKELFNEIKTMVETGSNLDLRRKLGVDERTVGRRKHYLKKFLRIISHELPRPKEPTKPKSWFSTKKILESYAPDRKKILLIENELKDGQYIGTRCVILQFTTNATNNSRIFYHDNPDGEITVNWIDGQTLEIIHSRDINFSSKKTMAFDDQKIEIRYKET